MLADNLEGRIRQNRALRSPDLEKRVADLERLVGWLIGLQVAYFPQRAGSFQSQELYCRPFS